MVQLMVTPEPTVGVTLSDEDLQALKKLYSTVWAANVTLRNWKEKGTHNFCQWFIELPDKNNHNFTVSNNTLNEAVEKALAIHWQGVDEQPRTY
jgi:hypothetical protein